MNTQTQFSTKLVVFVTGLLLAGLWFIYTIRATAHVGCCDMWIYESELNNAPLNNIFIPLVQHARPGIHGLVTLNGAPIADIPLLLRFFDGAIWSTYTTITTGTDGRYNFLDIPALAPGQKYYVLYQNDPGTYGQLWVWGTRVLSSYATGSSVAIGDFDLMDIALIAPPDGVTVALPYNFQWMPRPTTLTDVYEFNLYNPVTSNPYFYTQVGYTDTYTLNNLPLDFNVDTLYFWEVWVLSPDGGFGISYNLRVVYFSNSGLTTTIFQYPIMPKTISDLEEIIRR
ncbi:MAG: hypothetical protein Fur0022_38650 [Anaerolineales bacterium]